MTKIRALTDDTYPVETAARDVLAGDSVGTGEALRLRRALANLSEKLEKGGYKYDPVPYDTIFDATDYGPTNPRVIDTDAVRQTAKDALLCLDKPLTPAKRVKSQRAKDNAHHRKHVLP